jgi:GntR family transcriptional regulator
VRVPVAGSDRAEPAFRRVWSDLRAQILADEFADQTALPTEAEIAAKYSISRQTVRRAFQELVAEDLVFRVPGRGTFATPTAGRYLRQFGSIDDLLALSTDSELQVLRPLTGAVDPACASRLRLPDDRVAAVTFVRVHHGEPFSHTTVYLPPDVCRKIGDVPQLTVAGKVSPITVIGLLDRALEAPIQDAEQSITVGTARGEVSESLDLSPGTPLLRIDRMYFDATGSPVELAISHFHPDRYSYRVRLRRKPA